MSLGTILARAAFALVFTASAVVAGLVCVLHLLCGQEKQAMAIFEKLDEVLAVLVFEEGHHTVSVYCGWKHRDCAFCKAVGELFRFLGDPDHFKNAVEAARKKGKLL